MQEAAHVGVSEKATIAPRKVLRHSVRGQILDALRAALVDGELAPGEIYSGPALGERFGVSATPVREAMQQLALEGAVECLPNRGFRVLTRTPRALAELAEVRALLEVPVMSRLARTLPASVWESLRPAAAATAKRRRPATSPDTPTPTGPSTGRCSPSPATSSCSRWRRTSTAGPSGPCPARPGCAART